MSFIVKMQLSSRSMLHSTVCSMAMPGHILSDVTFHLIYIYINFILSTMAVTRGICLSLSLLLWIATWGFVCVCVCLFVCVCVCVCSLSSCVLLRLGRCVWGGGSFYSCVCCREGSWGNRVCLCVFVHKHIQPATALFKKEASILHICYWKQNSKTLKECIEVLSKPNN